MSDSSKDRRPYHVVAVQMVLLLGTEIHDEAWPSRNDHERIVRVGVVLDFIDLCQLPGDDLAKRGLAFALRGNLQQVLDGARELLQPESIIRMERSIARLSRDFGLDDESAADEIPPEEAALFEVDAVEDEPETWDPDAVDEPGGETELEQRRRQVGGDVDPE